MPVTSRQGPTVRCALATALLLALLAPAAHASSVLLKDGRVLHGKFAPIAKLTKDLKATGDEGALAPQLILMCDDDLRRTFVPKRNVLETREADKGEIVEKFKIPQRTPRSGIRVANVADVVKIGTFDEFGRREFTLRTGKGPVTVIQQITEITPEWTKLEGYKHIWDQRIATSSIPPDVIRQVLSKRINPKDMEQRLKLARFLLQSERYPEADAELQQIVKDFPDLKAQIEPVVTSLRQLNARQVLRELDLREKAGQYQLVGTLLQAFPERFPAAAVSGEILQEVREKQEALYERATARETTLDLLKKHLGELSDDQARARLQSIYDEIVRDLNLSTIDRLTPYRQFADDPQLSPSEKLALAVSGWLIGSGGATNNFAIAMSLEKLRNLTRQYLAQTVKVDRERILGEMRALEGAVPKTVAQVIANMQPPLAPPEPVKDRQGLYELQFPGQEEEPVVNYTVQLPPEYDPYRKYPTIVTLHGNNTTPALQLDWWAGVFDEQGRRQGQAARQGYIVIAPQWGRPGQMEYGYTATEHHAVLGSLRDACRHFAIDTDRVYLSGHSMGGDAAWDIGLAHPDLWAGVIPIVAQADKYVHFYEENARYVPIYLVGGELDGDKFDKNASDLDQYMIKGYNITYVEYLGRGHEHFSDEILRIFDWMGRFKRDFFPKQFEVRTVRPWDDFFWWVEVAGYPAPLVIQPNEWPAPRGRRAMQVNAKVTATNGIHINCGAEQVIVWLAPEFIDLNRPIQINVRGMRNRGGNNTIQADVAIILEDVRTRADRQHPFWARVEMPSGRVNLAENHPRAPRPRAAD